MSKKITIRGAGQNNLKDLDLDLAINTLTVVTGVSGSGKSSLAFDTVYAEGQRRYIESFSAYARQFMDRMDKPAVKSIEGILPSIAINQINPIKTSRSTLGTLTEINDYMKLLFPRLATLHCRACGGTVRKDSSDTIADRLIGDLAEQPCTITFPLRIADAAVISPADIELLLRRQGFFRVLDNAVVIEISPQFLNERTGMTIDILVDRLIVSGTTRKRLIDSLETALKFGKGRIDVFPGAAPGPPLKFSSALHCPQCDIGYREPTPSLFSFNSPLGACAHCNGFGKTIEVDLDAVIPDRGLTLNGDAIKPWSTPSYREAYRDLIAYCKKNGIPTDVPFRDLPQQSKELIIQGDADFYGVTGFFNWLETKTYKMHIRVLLSKYRAYETCSHCRGTRFKAEPLQYRIDGKSIADIYGLATAAALVFFKGLQADCCADKTVTVLLEEICNRLHYLVKVGLGYLTLDRQSRTLSGGEIERASLTRALGSSLLNTLYILDEPSIGLHPRDTHMLTDILKELRDLGNTILVVEHDPDIIMASDAVLDLGPGSGEQGGSSMFFGTPQELLQSSHSLTGRYLSGDQTIPVPKSRRQPDRQSRIVVRDATSNNLQNITLTIPTRQLVCITGVSGSGKSTLLEEVIHKSLSKGAAYASTCFFEGSTAPQQVLLMDQSPIGKTPRSNPATYMKAFDALRSLFAQTEQARERGYTASSFSFNTRGGRCELCQGEGFERVEMQFLADVFVTCPACRGTRYLPEILEVTYQGKNIHQVLNMTVADARAFFADMPKIAYPLRLLEMVGLGYLRLGQASNTLSGGEAQRLKIAAFIRQASDTKTLFLFDEPTTGLHFDDIRMLLQTFAFLISQGHSIIVVEHNLEMVKCADHVIDLGPEGGEGGGRVVFSGTPERLLTAPGSYTGRYLRHYLTDRVSPAPPPATMPAAPELDRASDGDIIITGAREHNLKNISTRIPRDQVVVITGLSGSGKSTLAFDIIYAEGQRRFLETLSPYARQYINQMQHPEVDTIRGLPPTVAIEQLLSRGGKKSTVATVTEIYHYLRLLFAKIGRQHCPQCGKPLTSQTPQTIVEDLQNSFRGRQVMILAPQVRGRKGLHKDIIQRARKEGCKKIRIDGTVVLVKTIFAIKRYHEHQIELITAECDLRSMPADQLQLEVNRALALGNGELAVLWPDGTEKFYSLRASCPTCKISVEEPDPRLFSFNSSHGECPACSGMGTSATLSPDLLIADRDKTISGGALAPLTSPLLGSAMRKKIQAVIGEQLRVPLDTALKNLSAAQARRLFSGKRATPGLIALLEAPALQRKAGWAELLDQFRTDTPCAECRGSRLNAAARSVKISEHAIHDLTRMTPGQLLDFLDGLSFTPRHRQIAEPVLQELRPKLTLLQQAGLSYLTLNRSADTLSGGEAQRIRLAAQVASNLRGVAYVLDEPTVGLHPHDNHNLLGIIRELQQKGNSVIIVEHDEETIRNADYIIDLGPGGGTRGGTIVAAGTLQDILQNPASVTGMQLCGKHQSKPFDRARSLTTRSGITVSGACQHNLKDISARFPAGRLTVVTGVSGSGKTTLVRETIYKGLKKILGQYHGAVGQHASLTGAKQLKRVVEIDQSPIGKTPRSIPATYIGFYDTIRNLFAQVPDARMRGYAPARFSFNLGGGRCEKCSGQGKIKVTMSFLPDMYIDCDVCQGRRFNEETLGIRFKGKTISEVLTMTVEEGCALFQDIPALHKPLEVLNSLGLGYITLGQPSPTLSGGEAQRIKIAAELCKNNHGKTVYILDEPTTGLHSADIRKLMHILQELVDLGNTIIIIEHNLEVIEQADYIIDLGPLGGDNGGTVVASGSPQEIAHGQFPDSLTARYLHRHISRNGFEVA